MNFPKNLLKNYVKNRKIISEVSMFFYDTFRENKTFCHTQSHKVFRRYSNTSYLVTELDGKQSRSQMEKDGAKVIWLMMQWEIKKSKAVSLN